MNQEKIILENFIKYRGEGEKYADASIEIIQVYKQSFVINRENENVLIYIWENHGFRNYSKGLFWIVNPDEYNLFVRKFSGVSNEAIVFARTNLGNLFFVDNGLYGKGINYLNIHNGRIELAGRGFSDFFEWKITDDDFWKKKCYGKMELRVVSKGELNPDECWTFVPALALGGDEKILNLQKVKIKENLQLLAQLNQ